MDEINETCQDLMYELIDPDAEQALVAVLTHDALKNGGNEQDTSVERSIILSSIRHQLNNIHRGLDSYAPEKHINPENGMLYVDNMIAKLIQLRNSVLSIYTLRSAIEQNLKNRTYLPEPAMDPVTIVSSSTGTVLSPAEPPTPINLAELTE